MKKRIIKKHVNIANKVYSNIKGNNKLKCKRYYTWDRSNFIMYLMKRYYGINYYRDSSDTKADKFCFW